MLQVQTVQADPDIVRALGMLEERQKIRIRFPTFLFASGQISCTAYEGDEEASIINIINKGYFLQELIEKFVQKQTGDLWKNIAVDIVNLYGLVKNSNFIIRPDGTLVLVDPFYYTTLRGR